jgi:hypothetical protein
MDRLVIGVNQIIMFKNRIMLYGHCGFGCIDG